MQIQPNESHLALTETVRRPSGGSHNSGGACDRDHHREATRRRRAARRSERGQSLVEFALVLPMLLVLLFGIIEFGVIITDKISLTNAARDGARAGSLTGATAGSAVARAQVSATGLIQCPLQTPTAVYSGGQVTVTVQCSYAAVTPLSSLIRLLDGGSVNIPMTISASTTMKVEE